MIILEIEEKDLQILSLALGKLPYEIVAQFINKIQQQIDNQSKKT